MQETTIRWCDGGIYVEPAFPDSLLKKLKYWRRQLEWSEERMARISTGQYEQLYVVDSWIDPNTNVFKQRLYTYPGFLHRIKTALAEAGWRYRVIDERTPFPEPDVYGACAHLRTYQYEAAYKALVSGGGIISAPTGFGKTALMAALIKGASRETLQMRNTPLIVVTAPDKDINAKNYRDFIDPELNFLPGRDVGLVMTGHNKFSDDIQVITLDSLHRIDPDDVGVLIVDEVHTAASDKRSEHIGRMIKARKWGVSATPTGRFDGRDLVTEGLFGPLVYSCTYGEAVKFGALVPITVYWVECPEPDIGLERFLRYKTRDGKYRQGVWRNHNRNAIIADILDKLPQDMQAMCIMQRLDQMNSIYPLCKPGVEFVHGNTSADEMAQHRNLRAISAEERKSIYARMAEKDIKRILSTYVYKQGVNFPHLECVINAGGGGSDIVAKQIPGRESRKTADKTRSILIDFVHRWDTTTNDKGKVIPGPIQSDDLSRERAYSQLGFEQVWIKDLNQIPELQPGR